MVDEERKETVQLSILGKSQEILAEKQTVKVKKVIDGLISFERHTLGIGETLGLAGPEGVSADGEGSFQAVVRYRSRKLPETVASQGRTSQG
jgi:hypothetical protein